MTTDKESRPTLSNPRPIILVGKPYTEEATGITTIPTLQYVNINGKPRFKLCLDKDNPKPELVIPFNRVMILCFLDEVLARAEDYHEPTLTVVVSAPYDKNGDSDISTPGTTEITIGRSLQTGVLSLTVVTPKGIVTVFEFTPSKSVTLIDTDSGDPLNHYRTSSIYAKAWVRVLGWQIFNQSNFF